MAEQTQQQDPTQTQEANGGANGGHKNAVRAAAIAAATGAAAVAAKKAFSSRDKSGEGTQRSTPRRSGGGDSTLAAMATSGLAAAKDSLLPFTEDAAGAAGEWIGRNGPDYLTDTIVPQFISGFERGRGSSQQQSE
ncbi:MAG TPA: hypothetical protein VG144_14460 [Gaiellaceae bacterium]|nr:hypothetical protein [Gaiellaceae bacterium]